MFNFFLILFTLYKISREYPSLLKNENATTTISQTGTSDQNFIDKLNNIEDCSCKLDDNMCNYHCCCDSNCNDNNINEWREKNLCIDEKNSLNKAPYICISKDYFLINMLKHNKIRKRRGFEIRNLEKDYCFQIDNSDYQTEKYSTKLINAVNDNEEYRKVIFDEYIESEILKIDSNPIQEFESSPSNDKFTGIYINSEDNIFIKDNYFIVYGPDLNGNCIPIPVQFYKRIEQSKCKYIIDRRGIKLSNINNILNFHSKCVMETDEVGTTDENNDCEEEESSEEIEGLIVEIEFVLYVNKINQTINNDMSYYNLVYTQEEEHNEITFNVRFNEYDDTNNNNVKNIGIFQSGRIGYSIGQPLIVKDDNNYIYRYGYVIYGTENGICTNIVNNVDPYFQFENGKTILFGESFTYSCKLEENENETFLDRIKKTLVYQTFKRMNICFLGSPIYENEYFKINFDAQINQYQNPKIFRLNIYVDNIGPSDGPIYKIMNPIDLQIEEDDNNDYISFEINYIFIKSAKNYKTTGSVLPKMPYDIIQPFVELDI